MAEKVCFLCTGGKSGVGWDLESLEYIKANLNPCPTHLAKLDAVIAKKQAPVQHAADREPVIAPTPVPVPPAPKPALGSAELVKVEEEKSNQGGKFYYAFFKLPSGEWARSCLYPNFGNFTRWAPLVRRVIAGESIRLENLAIKGKMVDADSDFREAA